MHFIYFLFLLYLFAAELEVEDLRKVTKEELMGYFDRLIARESPLRRALAVRVFSTGARERHEALIGGDDADYKETLQELTLASGDATDAKETKVRTFCDL